MKLELIYQNKKKETKKYKLNLKNNKCAKLAKLLLKNEISQKQIKKLESTIDLSNFNKLKLKSIKLDGKKVSVDDVLSVLEDDESDEHVFGEAQKFITTGFRMLDTIKDRTGIDVEDAAWKKMSQTVKRITAPKTKDGRIVISKRVSK